MLNSLIDRKLIGWCQRRDLNPRPKAYESSALPLSYSGIALCLQALLHSARNGCLTLSWRGFVKGLATPGTASRLSRAPRQHRRGNYSKLFNQRKRRVRGLWRTDVDAHRATETMSTLWCSFAWDDLRRATINVRLAARGAP